MSASNPYFPSPGDGPSSGQNDVPPLQQLEHGLAEAGNVLHDQADQWAMTGDEWAESLRCTVREHPLATVAAALAFGVVLSRLTR